MRTEDLSDVRGADASASASARVTLDSRPPTRAQRTAHTTARHRDSSPEAPGSRTLLWLPLVVALTWMLGTFGAFWLGGMSDDVPNPGQLCLFVLSATAVFAFGYAARIRRTPRPVPLAEEPPARIRRVRQLVLWSACYYTAVGLTKLDEFGATGPGSVWASIQNPAAGYVNKLEVYEIERHVGQAGPTMLLMLLGVLGTALVPLLVVYWRRLSVGLRIVGLTGIAAEAAYYLYIGTQKGLGDTAVMLAAGLLIVAAARPRKTVRPRHHTTLTLATAIIALFSLYMVHSQAARAGEFGTSALVRPSPVIEDLVGHNVAAGVAATVFYPTHGYLGLAHNLETPFSWSYGLGSSPTAASIAAKYFGADPNQYTTYAERTEARTGWPAWLYWTTIYPWLASDLTFPGTVLFMGAIGWLFAMFWIEAAFLRRTTSMLIFGQLCIFIAYIPANNQLGMSLQSITGMATLLTIYVGSSLIRGARPTGPFPERPAG